MIDQNKAAGEGQAPDRPSQSRSSREARVIVAIGTSAGGLEALRLLFEQLPGDTGMAFVVIQHLSPDYPSLLGSAIARTTGMSVVDAVEGMPLVADRVHVMPAATELSVAGGVLHLAQRPQQRGPHHPVDVFFRALAADCGDRAIGVVLSGTGSDGTQGLKAIKEAGGITIAQDPDSAQFSGMPESAIAAGLVDWHLPPGRIAAELTRLSREPWLATGNATDVGATEGVQRAIAVLQQRTGVDFSSYKISTVSRRIARRAGLRGFASVAAYADALEADPGEATALSQDMLIHVTSFFRDPGVFEVLRAQVLPELLRQKDGTPIRIWIPGCSTGEETYSVAICVLESLEQAARQSQVQIFGSDLSGKAIEQARAGVFAESALQAVGPERLARFFDKTGPGYRVNKRVRDLCVFAEHDLTRDPPFIRLDLISCRNVLIYFEPALQRRVLPMFHQCLNSPGYLLLGRSENIAGFDELFTPVEPERRIFSKRGESQKISYAHGSGMPGHHPPSPETPGLGTRPELEVQRQASHLLLTRYAPPGVIVDDQMQIIQFRGETGAFLAPPPGQPQLNLLKMARPGLLPELGRAVEQARERRVAVRAEGVKVRQRQGTLTVDLQVVPLLSPRGADDRHYLILFEEPGPRLPMAAGQTAGPPGLLEEELLTTKQYLQSMVEQQQASSQEFAAVNEELMAANEELQSTNEELQSAKEELQSVNEELTTVNDELRDRNHALDGVANDLLNVLEGVNVPIVIVDAARRIRRYAPESRSLLNMIASDVGRPLADIKLDINVTDLDERVRQVIETMLPLEAEVQDGAGRWHQLQIRPYRTLDRRLDGALISLTEIDKLKRAVAGAEQANRDKDRFLSTLSHELRTPLTTLLMQTRILEQLAAGDAKVEKAIAAIGRAAGAQARLIDDLLDVARIISGKIGFEGKVLNLGEVARGAAELLGASAKAKAIELAFEETTRALVLGDFGRLQQVVMNLLGNAIKFTPAGGSVRLSLEASEGQARLAVTDTGIGIKPETLPRIFDRFVQLEATSTRLHGGLGLGLSIARHLAEAHRGTVSASSPGEGQGATFVLALPLHVGPEAPAERPAPSPPAQVIAGLRVLVVEDDDGARQAMTAVLAQLGAEVCAAASAAEALEQVTAFRPEVLLSDLAMPGEDGFSLIAKVRELAPELGGRVPAAAVSALASEEDRRRALAAGFQLHLAKPIDPDRLARAIADLASAAHR